MGDKFFLFRSLIAGALILLTACLMHILDKTKAVSLQRPLSEFPSQVGQWRARADQPLDAAAARILGVDDYVSRNYVGPEGQVINFYVSYFSHIDRTKGYHSPLNCMPGSGWNILSTQVVPLTLANGQTIRVRKVLFVNGDLGQLGLYWYQCRGRFLPTEYEERIYRVLDSVVKGRTDGAFVRIIIPVTRNPEQDYQDLAGFTRAVVPILERFLP